jgi:hypothetical protein
MIKLESTANLTNKHGQYFLIFSVLSRNAVFNDKNTIKSIPRMRLKNFGIQKSVLNLQIYHMTQKQIIMLIFGFCTDIIMVCVLF